MIKLINMAKKFIFFGITMWLFTACNNDTEFARIVHGKIWGWQDPLFIIFLTILLSILLSLWSITVIMIIRLMVWWCRWTIEEKKYTGPFLIILLLLSIGLYQGFRPKNIEFTRIMRGKTWALQHDNFVYYETILVKDMPKNTITQSKIMIAYFDSAGFSKGYLSDEMPEINSYSMSFYKSTRITRRHFAELGKYWAANQPVPRAMHKRYYNGNKTYLGSISITRCKDNAAKWRVMVFRNVGRDDGNYEQLGPTTVTTILLNECSPKWSRSEKEKVRDSTLAGYYMELQDKKHIKRLARKANLL